METRTAQRHATTTRDDNGIVDSGVAQKQKTMGIGRKGDQSPWTGEVDDKTALSVAR